MLDPSSMWPNGFHFGDKSKRRDWKGHAGLVFNAQRAQHYTRTQRPPRYWLVDFGLTQYYDPAKGSPLDWAIRGRDRSVPEFQRRSRPLVDPFPVDVYYLGNWVREDFMNVSYTCP